MFALIADPMGLEKCTMAYARMLSRFSRDRPCATLGTVAHQAPLSRGFSRQEYWSGLPCPPPGDLPHPRTEPESPALAGRFFTTSATWEAYISWCQGLFQLLLLSLSFLTVSQDKIIVYVLTLRQKTQKISQEQGSVLLTYWSSFSELYILVWGLSLT